MKARFPGLLACALLLFGCGGGGGGDSGDTAPPAPIATQAGGIWAGTATTSGVEIDIIGVVTEDGEGRFLDDNGTQYVIDKLGGTGGDISLELTAFAEAGFTFIDGSTVATGTLNGTVDERTTFSGEYTLATGETGTLSMSFDELYDRDSSLDKLEGMWDEEFGILQFDPDGSFFEQDVSGCVYSGKASIIDADFNVYALSMTISSCGLTDGDYTGVGVLSDVSATNDTFVLQMNSDTLIMTTSITRL